MKKKLTTLGISTVLAVTSIAFTAPAGHAVNDESEIDSFIQSIFHPPAWKGPAGNLGAFGAGSSYLGGGPGGPGRPQGPPMRL